MGSNHKRVLLISVHGDPLASPGSIESGGQNIYVRELMRHLHKLGWAVDVMSRLNKKKKRTFVKVHKDVNVIRMPAGPAKFISKDSVYEHLPEFLSNTLSYILNEKKHYSIIHSNYWLSGWVGMELKKILNIPLTHTYHSLGYIRYQTLKRFGECGDDQSEVFKKRIQIEKEILSVADKVIATSTFEKMDLIKYYEAQSHKLRIIPVGVDEKKFQPQEKSAARNKLGIPQEAKVLLYVGRLEWRKGLDTLIEALTHVLLKRPLLKDTLRLFVVGGPRKRPLYYDNGYKSVKQAVASWHLEKNVSFQGGVSQRFLATYYAASDMVIVPSYYEPFGIIPLEAMSMGIPTIASKTGGLQYTIRHKKTGILTPPHRPTFLANRIIELLEDTHLYARLQTHSRLRIKQYFTWNKVAKAMSRFYSAIIKNATITSHT